MPNNIKYVHTNIIAKDWKKLSQFYIHVFGCIPIYPERNLSGEWLEKLTRIKKIQIRGIHLALPGYENGPTLEIFEYTPENLKTSALKSLNLQGLGHLAFHVTHVASIVKKLIEHGGSTIGEEVKQHYPELNKTLTVVYAQDPEGNFIELQNWKILNNH